MEYYIIYAAALQWGSRDSGESRVIFEAIGWVIGPKSKKWKVFLITIVIECMIC